MEGHHSTHRLNPCAFGGAAGITWGLGVLIMGILAAQYQYGKPFVDFMSTMYLGYGATLKGSLIGAGWAVVDGFVSVFIFAWIYNLLLLGCCKLCHKKSN